VSEPDLVVVWRVYEPCNLACRFCGYSRDVVRPRHVADPGTLVAFGEVLAGYQQRTGRAVLLSWLGGEPLLWPALPKVSRVLRRLGLRLGVTTNGVPLAAAAVRESLQDYDQVTVSVDGLAPFHDHVRDSPGLFERVRENVRLLRAEIGEVPLLRVNTVLMRGNVGTFAAFCDEVAGWGFAELTFNQLGGDDRPEFYPANRLLPDQVARFTEELPVVCERVERRGLRILGSTNYLRRIAATAHGECIPVSDCEPARRFLFIDERDRVSPCSFTCGDYSVPLSGVDTPAKLVELPARFAAMRAARRMAACDDCHSTQAFEKFKSSVAQARMPLLPELQARAGMPVPQSQPERI
jgi:MoaA/NifB/PqqE/SkfB family radical SAM enzyme